MSNIGDNVRLLRKSRGWTARRTKDCSCDQNEVLVKDYGEHYVDCPEFEPPLTHAERREIRKLLRRKGA